MDQKRLVLGLTERVTLLGASGKKIAVTARVDTGATTSSLDSSLRKKLDLGPILHTKTIRSASGKKRRPGLKAWISIRGLLLEAEFNLADRQHMTYPILLGQNILKKGFFLIDPWEGKK